jgi:recombination protein RecR
VPSLPEPIQRLASALNKLPGIGPRSSERLALYLAQADPGVARELASAVTDARAKIKACEICGALAEATPCRLCQDERRDASLLCLVERPTDILSLEKSAGFRGRYHVLGGKISPLNGVEPEDLRIAELERRLATEPVKEVILALGSDVEGDATSFYLAQRLARPGLKISRLAQGLPAGGGLEFADEITLSRAIEGRRELS